MAITFLAVTWGANLPFSEMMGEPTSGLAAALSLVSRSLPLSAPPGPLRPVHPRYEEKNGGNKEVNSRISPLVAIIYQLAGWSPENLGSETDYESLGVAP